MSYQFSTKLTEEDFVEFNKYACWSAPWQKATRIKYTIQSFILVTIIFVCSILVFQKIDGPIANTSLLVIISCIMLTILTIFVYRDAPEQVAKRARKFIRKDENKHILEENILTLDEGGIHCKDPRNDVMSRWTGIVRFAETRDYFYLFINDLQGHIIPKKQFRDQNEIAEFNEFLARHIPLSVSFRSLEK